LCPIKNDNKETIEKPESTPLKELEINNEGLINEMFKKPGIGLSKTITHSDIARIQENAFIIDVENLGIISPEDICVSVHDKVVEVEGSKNSQNSSHGNHSDVILEDSISSW
jgi:hypothetical protein